MLSSQSRPRITELLPDVSAPDFGAAMLRLAHMAAALERAEPGLGMMENGARSVAIHDSHMDKAGHGCLAEARSAQDHGPGTTEGDR